MAKVRSSFLLATLCFVLAPVSAVIAGGPQVRRSCRRCRLRLRAWNAPLRARAERA